MKRGILILLLAAICALNLFSKETGKVISRPSDKKKDLLAKEGVMIAKDYAKPGIDIVQSPFFLNIPIYSIAKQGGDIYIGTGSIPMIINTFKGDTIASFEDGQTVYDMETGADGQLYAAIQPEGFIVRIGKGKADTVCDFGGKSINFIARLSDGMYAAVENTLYKINGSSAEKVYEAQDRNITCASGSGKSLVIGTEGNGKIILVESGKGKTILSFDGAEISYLLRRGDSYYAVVNRMSQAGGGSEGSQSLFLKIRDGAADTLINSQEIILGAVESDNGIFLYMSLTPGIVFYDYKDIFSAGMLESDFIMKAKNIDGTLYFTTAEPGRIYMTEKQQDMKPFVSGVIDFGKKALLNSISYKSDEAGKMFVRMGNTPDVDSTWTGFMIVRNETAEQFAESRYIQYRYSFKSSSDRLMNVSMYYKTANHEPEIKSIRVYQPCMVPDYAAEDIISKRPLLKKKLYPEYNSENMYLTDDKVIFASWESSDADGDRLSYDIALENRDGSYFVQKGTRDPYVLIRTDGFIDGNYVIRVTAADTADNREGWLTGSLRSDSVTIDNQEPKILEDKFELNRLSFTAVDSGSKIKRAYVSINGGEYIELMPTDDIFDSKVEYFRTDIDRKKGEELLIMMFAVDQSGNIGKLRKAVK